MEQKTEQQRKRVIQGLADLLECSPFSVEYKVKAKPEGIKIIIEVTQQQMDDAIKNLAQNGIQNNE